MCTNINSKVFKKQTNYLLFYYTEMKMKGMIENPYLGYRC